MFSYLNKDDITVMAMAQSEFPREILYNFVQSLFKEFMDKYGDKLDTLSQYGLQSSFSQEIKAKMDHYNKNKENMKGDELLEKLEDSVKAMKVNLIKTGGRGLSRNYSVERRKSAVDCEED